MVPGAARAVGGQVTVVRETGGRGGGPSDTCQPGEGGIITNQRLPESPEQHRFEPLTHPMTAEGN